MCYVCVTFMMLCDHHVGGFVVAVFTVCHVVVSGFRLVLYFAMI